METPSSVRSDVVGTVSATSHCPALHAAAWGGNMTVLEQMLSAGENPNTGDDWNLTPIMSTLMRHSLQDTRCIFRARKTIQRNLVVDCREEDAERVATTSAVLNLLLRYGADPDARNNGDKTTLHYATSDGLYEAAKLLLSAGATIDAQDKDGQSPLYCAVQERGLLVTNLLVSQGASIDLKDKNGVSSLSLVIQKGYVDAMQIFLNHHALVATRERLDFAGDVLLQAVEEKSTDIVRFLVESGYVTLDYQNIAGETAMHRAIAQRNTLTMEILRELDTTGQSLRVVTARGESCFHFAARVASVGELKILLEFWEQVAGAEEDNLLNGLDTAGATPLLAAATAIDPHCARDRSNLFIDRHAKMKLLMPHGAVLLRSEVLPGGAQFRRSSQHSGIIMCAQVRRCLTQWLEECQDECDGDLVWQFCTKWVINVVNKPNRTTLVSVLNLSVCAGYAVDVLPLLLMLPHERTTITDFLQSLEGFKSGSNGLQFDCLARELSASWAYIT